MQQIVSINQLHHFIIETNLVLLRSIGLTKELLELFGVRAMNYHICHLVLHFTDKGIKVIQGIVITHRTFDNLNEALI